RDRGTARQLAGAVRRGRAPAGDRPDHAIVRGAVEVVVASVAHFGLRQAVARADIGAVVDQPVAVVVLAVAGLALRAVQRRAALALAFVDLAVAVVVDVVADLARVVAGPVR